jgi:hypothetical protein
VKRIPFDDVRFDGEGCSLLTIERAIPTRSIRFLR